MREKIVINIFIFIFIFCLFTSSSVIAINVNNLGFNSFLDKSKVFIEYTNGLNFSAKENEMPIKNKPYLGSDAILISKVWKYKVSPFCEEFNFFYRSTFRSRLKNNTNQDLMLTGFKEKLSTVEARCKRLMKNQLQFINAKYNATTIIPKRLKYLENALSKAKKSYSYAKLLFANRATSTAINKVQTQDQVSNLIKVYKILGNNGKANKWQQQLDSINKALSEIAKQQSIYERYVILPKDIYVSDDGDTLRQRIKTILVNKKMDADNVVLASQFMDKNIKRLDSFNRGRTYTAIPLYFTVGRGESRMLHYGWYEVNDRNNKDDVFLTAIVEPFPEKII